MTHFMVVSPMLRNRVALCLATIAAVAGTTLAAPAQASRSTVRVGIANQNPTMFDSGHWSNLRMKRTRHVVRWNAIDDPDQVARIDAFVDAARAKGVKVLLHISTHDFTPRKAALPSRAAYRKKVGLLIARYYPSGVREWGVWNEANDRTQPTYRAPTRAADYFKDLWRMLDSRKRCGRTVTSRCKIVALDLLDGRSSRLRSVTRSYVRKFYGRLSRRWDRRARIVGLHNYSDTNRRARGGTKNVIRQVRRYNRRAKLWMTETGGIVKLGTTGDFTCNPRSSASVRRAESRANRAVSWMFRLAKTYRRYIDRVYVYQWTGTDCIDAVRFDSGLVRLDGSRRPSWYTVKSRMRARLFKP